MPSEPRPALQPHGSEPHRYVSVYDRRGRFLGRLTLPADDPAPASATARALAEFIPSVDEREPIRQRSVELDADEAERRQRDFRTWLLDEWLPRNGVAGHIRDSGGRDIAEKSG